MFFLNIGYKTCFLNVMVRMLPLCIFIPRGSEPSSINGAASRCRYVLLTSQRGEDAARQRLLKVIVTDFDYFARPKAKANIDSWRPPAVIWCHRSSICIMDLPALRTISFFSREWPRPRTRENGMHNGTRGRTSRQGESIMPPLQGLAIRCVGS